MSGAGYLARRSQRGEVKERMARHAVWHGTAEESRLLLEAIGTHCACTFEAERRLSACPAHLLLVEDQAVLDRLLRAHRERARYVREEFEVGEASRRFLDSIG